MFTWIDTFMETGCVSDFQLGEDTVQSGCNFFVFSPRVAGKWKLILRGNYVFMVLAIYLTMNSNTTLGVYEFMGLVHAYAYILLE